MKEKTNLEWFDYYAAMLLSELLDTFPLPASLEIANFVKSGVPAENVQKHKQIIYYTIVWLRDNGFLKVGTTAFNYESASNMVLTAKGLEILKQVPESINGKSLGDGLKEAVKVGKDELIKQAVNKILSVSILGLQKIADNF